MNMYTHKLRVLLVYSNHYKNRSIISLPLTLRPLKCYERIPMVVDHILHRLSPKFEFDKQRPCGKEKGIILLYSLLPRPKSRYFRSTSERQGETFEERNSRVPGSSDDLEVGNVGVRSVFFSPLPSSFYFQSE